MCTEITPEKTIQKPAPENINKYLNKGSKNC